MSRQKFNPGDTVRIADVLPDNMSHFSCDCEAVIVGSYEQKCGDGGVEEDGDDHQYTVIYANLSNECSWYPESVLTLVKAGTYESLMEVKSAYRKLAGNRPPEPSPKPSPTATAADKEMTRQWMSGVSGRDIAHGDDAEVAETWKDHLRACFIVTDRMSPKQRRQVYDEIRADRLKEMA